MAVSEADLLSVYYYSTFLFMDVHSEESHEIIVSHKELRWAFNIDNVLVFVIYSYTSDTGSYVIKL